jgi:hypothetical protein
MAIFDKLESWFKATGVKVSADFDKLFGANAAKGFATGVEAILKSAIGTIATNAVEDVEKLAKTTTMSSGEKFAAAFAQITEEAAKVGIQAAVSVKNMLIELVVQREAGSITVPATAAVPAPAGLVASPAPYATPYPSLGHTPAPVVAGVDPTAVATGRSTIIPEQHGGKTSTSL